MPLSQRGRRAVAIWAGWVAECAGMMGSLLVFGVWLAGLGLTCNWVQDHVGLGAAFAVFAGWFLVTGLVASLAFAWKASSDD